jgi:hypothetical protein
MQIRLPNGRVTDFVQETADTLSRLHVKYIQYNKYLYVLNYDAGAGCLIYELIFPHQITMGDLAPVKPTE